jgi:sulfur transfer complex TusBCD TusB component (DsrH family)
MARHFHLSLWFTVLSGCNIVVFSLPASPQQNPTTRSENVTLGQSSVPLYGPWKFTVGDSPTDPKTGRALWAESGFDDSGWENVDLTPNTGAFDPLSGESGYVPGWAVRGHAGYWGYAWYRIRVEVHARPGQELALAGPANIDDIYQVFANGRLVGQFGDFSNNPPTAYYTQPMMFPLPKEGNTGPSMQVLAFRVFMTPSTLAEVADVGGFHSAPVLGEAATVAASYQMSWLELIRGYSLRALEALLFGLTAVLAFTLILFDRTDRVYLWIGGLFLLQTASSALSSASSWTQHVSIMTGQLINDGLLTALIYAGWGMVWWVWFGRQRPAWTPRAAGGLAFLYLITIVIGQEMIVGLVPHRIAAAFLTASVVVRLLFLALQLWVVFLGIRRQGLEGSMVLPAVLLWGVGTFTTELVLLHIPIRWVLFGLSIRLAQVSNLLLLLVVGLLLLRRLLKSIHTQRMMALDVKQAQEVQQMILPEARSTLPGLIVESEYRPAREVGGDFFQVIPNKADGSLLIVAGDVAGKGLQAGMLVALLVGAIRTAASFNTDPRLVLGELNERLLGRNNAQATCLAMRIGSDGTVTLANAGHMAPYLNGEPILMEGALPLGMVAEAEISLMRFRLKEKDKLVLLSDGVVEAMDADGQLFGFDRVLELLSTTKTAAEVASAAQNFGQEDDISVISVTRTEVLETTAA